METDYGRLALLIAHQFPITIDFSAHFEVMGEEKAKRTSLRDGFSDDEFEELKKDRYSFSTICWARSYNIETHLASDYSKEIVEKYCSIELAIDLFTNKNTIIGYYDA